MVEFTSLGNFLKQKRVSKGLTQRELAEALGNLNSQFVSNWERGLCAPPGHAFQRLIDLLSINRKELVEVMLVDSRKVIERKIFPKKQRKLA